MGIIWLEWKEKIKLNVKILDLKFFDGIVFKIFVLLYYVDFNFNLNNR